MAIANAKRYDPADEVLAASPDQKLEQIMMLLAGPGKTTPSMLRVTARAIYEGIPVPVEHQEFIALAARAGLSRERRYGAYIEMYGSGPRGVWPGKRAPLTAVAPETDLYRYFDALDLLLYIGISDDLAIREASHGRKSSWMEFAVRRTVTPCSSRAEATETEAAAIKAECPLFNFQHNNTPEARRRLVEYLIERDRLDLLAPIVSRG